MSKDTLNKLRIIFAEALLCKPEQVDVSLPIADLGVDSILALQITKLMQETFGLPIDPSDLFNQVTIEHIGQWLDQQSPTVSVKDSAVPNQTSPESHQDKIAIIGYSGQFPGGENADAFWRLLIDKKRAIQSNERWDQEEHLGGYLEDIDHFDCEFFRVSPKEARLMDPQQRLFMQQAWLALEHAGVTEQLASMRCGVFAGCLPGDYTSHLSPNEEGQFNPYAFFGNTNAVLSGRVSYFLNLHGPTMTVDTACSTMLSALYLAVQSLEQDKCDIALCGAASVFSTSQIFKLARQANMLSTSGACHSFQTNADGFVPAECSGAFVLKKYSQAIKDNDTVYAVIEGIEMNHDGQSNGLAAPNAHSQAELISKTYKRNQLDIADVAYIETHGTGTTIGDKIELQGLEAAFKLQGQHSDKPYIGTCKPNMGHALTASGVPSLIKALKILETDQIPGQPRDLGNIELLNKTGFLMAEEAVAVQANKPLIGISAFGFSGTNVHMVVKKDPSKQKVPKSQGNYLIAFSAKTTHSLIKYLTKFKEFLNTVSSNDMLNMSYTLLARRRHWQHKIALIVKDKQDLIDKINTILESSQLEDIDPIDMTKINQTLNGIPVDEMVQTNKAFKKAYLSDQPIDWSQYFDRESVKVMSLPGYCFDTQSYWAQVNMSTNKDIPYVNFLMKLKSLLSKELEIDIDKIKDDFDLIDHGVDSLVALKLLKSFAHDEINVDVNCFFEHRKLKRIADYLQQALTSKEEYKVELVENVMAKPIGMIPKALPIPKAIKTQTVVFDDIQYQCFGEGPNLFCLPPLNTTASAWLQQIRKFAKDYQVIVPIYPGHGPDRQSYIPLSKLAQKLFRGFNQLNQGTYIDAIGWSLGGCLIQLMLKHNASSFGKIVLVNTANQFDEGLFEKTIDLRHELEKDQDYLQAIFEVKEQPVELISAQCPFNTLKSYYDELACFRGLSDNDQIRLKGLIIYGTDDLVVTTEDSQNLAQFFENGRVLPLKGQGHFLPLTSPFHFNRIVESYIKEG